MVLGVAHPATDDRVADALTLALPAQGVDGHAERIGCRTFREKLGDIGCHCPSRQQGQRRDESPWRIHGNRGAFRVLGVGSL